MKKGYPDSIFFLLFLVFLTSSFDVFLNLKLGGFAIRFAVLVMIILIIIYLAYQLLNSFNKRIKFLGATPFFIWFLFLTAFIPNSPILSRNIGYMAWLTIFTGFIIILPYFIETEQTFMKIIKIYLATFTMVAVFGLIQFSVGMAGIDLLTEQWWLDGSLPRINAFSYEPSYYSTYVLIAWVILFFLIIQNSKFVRQFNGGISFMIITLSLLLSTSRMGLLIMFLIIITYTINQIKNTFLTFKLKKSALPIFLIFSSFVVVFLAGVIIYFKKIKFMFTGLGLFGYAAHSSLMRITEFTDTLKAFWKSPFIGYSLGGIPPAIARLNGEWIYTQTDAKDFEGMNIFAETLAASGIFGFPFFIAFLFIIFYKSYKLIKALKPVNPEFSKLLFALLMGLFFELLILNMNQNILRAYLWIHIGIVNLSYFIGKKILINSIQGRKI